MTVRLTTARMALRPIVETDLEALLELDSDPEVMRYLTGGVPSPRSYYVDGAMERMLQYIDTPYGYWAAEQDGVFIGWFHLKPSVVDANDLEVGYRLRKSAWGQGLATEGSVALAKLAFEQLGETRLHAVALPENHRSTRVMEKLGMTCQGRMVYPLTQDEVVIYTCTKAEFIASGSLRA